MSTLAGYYEIDLAAGFNFRGTYDAANSYTAGDVVSTGTATFLAMQDIGAGIAPPGGTGWSPLGSVGTSGEDAPYQSWVYHRGASAPRAPSNADASVAAGRIQISSAIWDTSYPSDDGNPLYISWVRLMPPATLSFGGVVRLTGERGRQGEQGIPGQRGRQGERGPVGIPGPQGRDGQRGPRGRQGDPGDPGEQGRQGDAGPVGRQGDPGERGSKGDKGDQGDAGPVGAAGATGPVGAVGPKGDSQRVVYGRFASGVTPSSPTALGFNNGRVTGTGTGNDGASWNDDIPPVSGSYSVLWAAPVEIDNANNTLHVLDTPYPAQGERGEPGTAAMRGETGAAGPEGSFHDVLFHRFAAGDTITTPINARFNWDTRAYTNLAGWTTDVPSGTDPLWKLEIYVPVATPPTLAVVEIRGNAYLARGERGEAGPVGPQGREGPVGGTGSKGDKGDPGSAGPAGPKGDSSREIFIRQASKPATPTGITINATGSFTNLTSGGLTWDDDTPTGSEVLWAQVIQIDWSTTPNPTVTTLGTPYPAQGERGPVGTAGADGTDGTDGKFYPWVFQWSATRPADPSGVAYSINDGILTGLGSWRQAPTATGETDEFLWLAQLEVSGTTVSYITTVRISGPAGATGSVGPQGPAGQPVQMQFSVNGTSGWAAVVTDPYFIRFSTDGGTTWGDAYRFRQDGARGQAGAAGSEGRQGLQGNPGQNGYSYQNFYHANTADSVGTPNVDYDGTSFSNVTSGWGTMVPTTPAGANVFIAVVRYREGTAGETIEGVILSGRVQGAVTPPPSTATSVRMTFGYTDTAGNPTGTAQQTDAVSLEVGDTHAFTVNFPATQAANQYFYASVPAGFTITRVTDDLEGDITSNWAVVSGRRRYGPLRVRGTVGRYSLTVRRDS